MVAFINKVGGIMYVDESREEEYKKAGYMLAFNSAKDEKPTEEKMKPKKKTKEV